METMTDNDARSLVDFNKMQSRRFFLAGTVAFPAPFLSIADLTIEKGRLSGIRSDEKGKTFFVVVRERQELQDAMTRFILLNDVSAIFFPGTREDGDPQGRFVFSDADKACDLEAGEWFYGSDIDVGIINESLKTDVRKPESGARGILFVPRDEPVLTLTERTQTAGATEVKTMGVMCDPTHHY